MTLRELAVAAFLSAAACILFFLPVWSVGMSLLQAVLEDRTGYNACIPAWEAARQGYEAGFFPIWVDVSDSPLNAYTWVWSNMNPLLLLTVHFDFIKAADLHFVSLIWLMAMSGYIFSRRSLNMSIAGAALTAVAFAFTGIGQKKLLLPEMKVPWTIPLFLMSAREILKKPRIIWMIACSLAAAACIYAGHPVAAFYMFLFGGLWIMYVFITEKPEITGALCLLFSMAMIALLLSGPQLITGLEGLFWNLNYHLVSSPRGGYSVEGIFSLALPWLVGTNQSNMASSFLAPYLGAVPVLLIIFGLTRLNRLGAHAAFFASYFITFLGLAFLLPLFEGIGLIPPFDRLNNSISAFPTMSFAAAVLSGLTFDLALRQSLHARKLKLWAIAAIPSTALIGWYAYYQINKFHKNPLTAFFFNDIKATYQSLISQLLFGCAVFLAMALATAWLSKRKNTAAIFIVLLAFTGLWVDTLGWNYENPGLMEKLNNSKTAQFLRAELSQGASEVSQCEFLDQNLFIYAKVRSFCAVSALFPKRHTKLLMKLNNAEPDSPEGVAALRRIYENLYYLPFPSKYFGTPLSNILGIKYFIACREPLPARGNLIFASDAAVYKNSSIVPEAFLTGKRQIMQNDDAVLEKMINLKSGEEYTALFAANDPGVSSKIFPTNFDDMAGQVFVTDKNWQKLELKVSAMRDSVLVNRILYYPGWKAWLDGRETRLLPADYLWRAVIVPKGVHTVVIKYVPAGFKIALWALLTTLPCLIIIPTLYRIKRKNDPISGGYTE